MPQALALDDQPTINIRITIDQELISIVIAELNARRARITAMASPQSGQLSVSAALPASRLNGLADTLAKGTLSPCKIELETSR